MMKTPDLLPRIREFALRILRVYASLPPRPVEQCLGKQLLRSGTSVGPHLHEGKRSRSNAEMVSKTEVALQELEESIYWMRLLIEANCVKSARLNSLLQEADQLTAILVASAKRQKIGASPSKPH